MRIKNIFKSSIIFALTLILTLTACDTSADNTDIVKSDIEFIEKDNTFSLIGTWRSRPDIDDTYYEAVVTADSDIFIYYFANNYYYLYWKGTFNTKAESDSLMVITSTCIESIDAISSNNEIPFILHTDGRLFFYDSNKYETPVSVYLNYITNAYIKEYAVMPFIRSYEEINTDTIENDIYDKNMSNNNEITQNDVPDIIIEDNSANNTTAENNVNNSANKKKEENTDTDVSTSFEVSDDTPIYTYTDKNETMYTTIALNIRSGPSTAFNIITAYSKGDAVAVTGICNETGWSRVDYNGITGYVDTSYLSTTVPVEETVSNNTEINNNTSSNDNNDTSSSSNTVQIQAENYTSGGFPLYNYTWLNGQYLGRVRIPAVGVNVALYNSSSQSVTDAYDSANCFYLMNPPSECSYTIIIADHQNQGFNAIKNCTYGTALYIDCVDGNTYKYVCDRIDYNGHNDSVHIYDSSWNAVDCSTGGLWCYTCNGNWQNVTIVHFSPV